MKRASSSLVLAAGLLAAFASSALAAGGTDAVMRSLDQVNRIYTPEKTTHTELLLRLNELGCHYRVNNRMLADPEDIMKHTFGWFYRMLPDDRGIANCFPVTVFFQNKDDGRDVIEIDGGAGGDRKALLSALKKRWGEPLVTKGAPPQGRLLGLQRGGPHHRPQGDGDPAQLRNRNPARLLL